MALFSSPHSALALMTSLLFRDDGRHHCLALRQLVTACCEFYTARDFFWLIYNERRVAHYERRKQILRTVEGKEAKEMVVTHLVLLRIVGGSSLWLTSASFTALRLGGILAGAPVLLMDLVYLRNLFCLFTRHSEWLTISSERRVKKRSWERKYCSKMVRSTQIARLDGAFQAIEERSEVKRKRDWLEAGLMLAASVDDEEVRSLTETPIVLLGTKKAFVWAIYWHSDVFHRPKMSWRTSSLNQRWSSDASVATPRQKLVLSLDNIHSSQSCRASHSTRYL